MEEKWYRQGEILIRKIGPKRKRVLSRFCKDKQAENVIREGEVSGHLHKLQGANLMTDGVQDGRMFFSVAKEAEAILTHDEHAPIKFPEGDYEVQIQREYDEGKYRYIAD